MTKVILLGDSIRQIGYGTKVPALLGENYEVWQPTDNCRFAQYTLRLLFDYRKQLEGADIIHWNNGLWDMSVHGDDGVFTPLEVYGDFMMRIAKALKKTTGKIIFATTTPVRPGHPMNSNEIAERYNAYIVPKLEAEGIIINDLYTLVSAHLDEYVRDDDNIHLTAAGIDACAEQICGMIKSIL